MQLQHDHQSLSDKRGGGKCLQLSQPTPIFKRETTVARTFVTAPSITKIHAAPGHVEQVKLQGELENKNQEVDRLKAMLQIRENEIKKLQVQAQKAQQLVITLETKEEETKRLQSDNTDLCNKLYEVSAQAEIDTH